MKALLKFYFSPLQFKIIKNFQPDENKVYKKTYSHFKDQLYTYAIPIEEELESIYSDLIFLGTGTNDDCCLKPIEE